MKKIALIILLVVTAFSASAEDLDPILKIGKRWECSYFQDFVGEQTFTISVVEKGAINGREYYILETTHGIKIAMLEEQGALYLIRSLLPTEASDLDSSNLVPIIDMNLNEGDTYIPYDIDRYYDYSDMPVRVRSVVNKDYRGKNRKTIITRSDSDYDPTFCHWVEGVGGATELAWIVCFSYANLSSLKVLKCWDGDELIFTKEDFNTLSALPSVIADGKDDTIIYNLQGMPVTEPRSGEIYIRSGMKFIHK